MEQKGMGRRPPSGSYNLLCPYWVVASDCAIALVHRVHGQPEGDSRTGLAVGLGGSGYHTTCGVGSAWVSRLAQHDVRTNYAIEVTEWPTTAGRLELALWSR